MLGIFSRDKSTKTYLLLPSNDQNIVICTAHKRMKDVSTRCFESQNASKCVCGQGWGSLQRFPRSPSWIWREGVGKRDEGKEKGKEGEGGEGKGTEGRSTSTNKNSGYGLASSIKSWGAVMSFAVEQSVATIICHGDRLS